MVLAQPLAPSLVTHLEVTCCLAPSVLWWPVVLGFLNVGCVCQVRGVEYTLSSGVDVLSQTCSSPSVRVVLNLKLSLEAYQGTLSLDICSSLPSGAGEGHSGATVLVSFPTVHIELLTMQISLICLAKPCPLRCVTCQLS